MTDNQSQNIKYIYIYIYIEKRKGKLKQKIERKENRLLPLLQKKKCK